MKNHMKYVAIATMLLVASAIIGTGFAGAQAVNGHVNAQPVDAYGKCPCCSGCICPSCSCDTTSGGHACKCVDECHCCKQC